MAVPSNNLFIETERLIMRNWRDEDEALFYEINNDPTIMEFFPLRRTREESNAFMKSIKAGINEKINAEQPPYGWFAVALKSDDKAIGYCGLADVAERQLSHPALEISWRLQLQHWGKGYVTEAALALLDYGFNTLNQPSILSLSDYENQRSKAVMERIGMREIDEKTYADSSVIHDHPDLKRFAYYQITKDEWKAQRAAAS